MTTPTLFDKIESRVARVAIVGQGYVGLEVAMAACEAGFAVVGLEADPNRYKSLIDGASYVEDVSDDKLGWALDNGYEPAHDPTALADFDVAVITVPTPLTDSRPDLAMVETAARQVGAALTPGALVVLESTTYPGTTQEVVQPILESESNGLVAGLDFRLGYSPERIDPGNNQWNLRTTPKVVSGIDDASRLLVEAFYGTFVDTLVPVDDTGVAELTKLIENTFRHVNIALMNELAIFAHDLGVDIWSAIDAASTKPFGFMPFRPGPGVGGHCLPVDPSYLSWRVKQQLGRTCHFVELANEINAMMPSYVVRRVQEMLNDHNLPVKGARILVFGYAYKADTSDARQTPARPIVEALASLGAVLTIIDPHVISTDIDFPILPDATASLFEAATISLIITPHQLFDISYIRSRSRLVFDATGSLDDSDHHAYDLI